MFFRSISTLLSFSFQSAFERATISSNDASPTSLSAFAHAWSADTNEMPTRMLICCGFPSKEKSAPDSYTPPMRFRVRFRVVWPSPYAWKSSLRLCQSVHACGSVDPKGSYDVMPVQTPYSLSFCFPPSRMS